MQNNKKIKAENDVKPKLPSGFHVEIDRTASNLSVSVCGVISILDFTDSAALLKVRGRKIKIVGSMLNVAVYENRVAEVSGRVSGVEFL